MTFLSLKRYTKANLTSRQIWIDLGIINGKKKGFYILYLTRIQLQLCVFFKQCEIKLLISSVCTDTQWQLLTITALRFNPLNTDHLNISILSSFLNDKICSFNKTTLPSTILFIMMTSRLFLMQSGHDALNVSQIVIKGTL